MNGPCCATCNAWLSVDESKGTGFCRAGPPQIVVTRRYVAEDGQKGMADFTSQFPPMKADGWCRAHQPKIGSVH